MASWLPKVSAPLYYFPAFFIYNSRMYDLFTSYTRIFPFSIVKQRVSRLFSFLLFDREIQISPPPLSHNPSKTSGSAPCVTTTGHLWRERQSCFLEANMLPVLWLGLTYTFSILILVAVFLSFGERCVNCGWLEGFRSKYAFVLLAVIVKFSFIQWVKLKKCT